MNIFDELQEDWRDTYDRLTRHHQHTQKNQPQPTPPQEAPVKIADLATSIKEDIGNGSAWIAKVAEEHIPGLLTEVQKLQASPIVQALEGLVLPPEVERQIAGIIASYAKLLPKAPAEAAPVEVAGSDQAAAAETVTQPA